MRTATHVHRLTWFWAVTVTILLTKCGHAFLFSPRYPALMKRPLARHVILSPFSTSTQARHIRPLFMNFNSNDPFQVLGMDEPTTDKKVIKRAYKRMALQYHPDVATTKDSSSEEKKFASDRFAKINWAYEVLSGKRENDSTYSSQSSTSKSTSSTSDWAPPHRRSGGYSSSSSAGRSSGGVDWTDFMPKVDEEAYSAGGDSFSKIFSDLLVGAAAGAAGLGGTNVFRDFIDFLEGNVDGFGVEDDVDLKILLQTGSLEEVRNELDDTELVVQQLKSKMSDIQDQIVNLTTKVKMTTRYMEKIETEESLAEQNARKEVVEGYIKKAQKRLLSLQTRYKELLTNGGKDPYARETTSSWDNIRKEASKSSPSSSYSTSDSSSSDTSTYSSSSNSGTPRTPRNEEDAWMNESFSSSSYGRGRGDGRRRSRGSRSTSTSGNSRQTTQSDPETTTQSTRSDTYGTQGTNYSSSSAASSGSARATMSNTERSSAVQSVSTNIPPHRRSSGAYENQQEKDKRRLRELKVDEEFEKLKKDLGL